MALQSRRTSLPVAIALSVTAVAAVTGAIYGLREVMPVEGSGVLYLLPARTGASDGFPPADVAWVLESAPGEVLVLRPDAASAGR
jgi:hypothetical protein